MEASEVTLTVTLPKGRPAAAGEDEPLSSPFEPVAAVDGGEALPVLPGVRSPYFLQLQGERFSGSSSGSVEPGTHASLQAPQYSFFS